MGGISRLITFVDGTHLAARSFAYHFQNKCLLEPSPKNVICVYIGDQHSLQFTSGLGVSLYFKADGHKLIFVTEVKKTF